MKMTRKKAQKWSVGLAIPLVGLAACSIAVKSEVFNNSTQEIQITYRAYAGMRTSILAKGKKLLLSSTLVEARLGSCTLTYREKIPPPEFVDTSGFYPRIHLQLEGGGVMFVLRNGDKAPVDVSAYEQPDGFPLVPDRDCR